jgi:hypothetical protein
MPKAKRQQQGMSFVGWVLSLFLFVIFALAAVRLIPVYLEYLTIRSAVDAAAHDQPTLSRHVIFRAIVRQFVVNQIDAIHSRNVRISRVHHHLVLSVDYSEQTPFIGNVGFIVHFHHSVNVPVPKFGSG